MNVYAKWAATGLTAALTMTMPVAASAADPAPASGTMVVLQGIDGGRSSYAASINGPGDIVGASYSKQAGAYVAVLWPHGTVKPVPLGLKDGRPEKINDHGVVAGTVGTSKFFLWRHGHTTYFPYRYRDDGMWITDLNNHDQVVGCTYNSATFSGHAFLLDHGRFTILPAPAGSRSTTTAINDSGQILGSVATSDSDRAVIWTRHGARWSFTDLGTLGGDTYPGDINAKGQVMGMAEVSGGWQTHPFLWQNGTMTDLMADHPAVGGAAQAMNNEGLVVGHLQVTLEGEFHAVTWQNGDFADISTAGYNSEAMAVNDKGQIGGLATPITPDQIALRQPFQWDAGTTTLYTSTDPLAQNGYLDMVGMDDAGHLVTSLVTNDESIILRSAD